MWLKDLIIRQDSVNKSTNHKCWRGCGAKGTLPPCSWQCHMLQPLWKTVRKYLRKLNIELSYDPEIPPLGIYPENKQPKQTEATNFP